jgi:hypothetical protein
MESFKIFWWPLKMGAGWRLNRERGAPMEIFWSTEQSILHAQLKMAKAVPGSRVGKCAPSASIMIARAAACDTAERELNYSACHSSRSPAYHTLSEMRLELGFSSPSCESIE